MALTIMCPNLRCRKILMVPTSMRGSRVRCKYCEMTLTVPKARAMHMMSTSERGKSAEREESGSMKKKNKR